MVNDEMGGSFSSLAGLVEVPAGLTGGLDWKGNFMGLKSF
jgi:hypothetical protein